MDNGSNTASLYCLTMQKDLIQMLAFGKIEFKKFAAIDIVFHLLF